MKYQSPYGQTIIISTEDFYALTDDQLKKLEETYANSIYDTIVYSVEASEEDN